MFYPVIFFFFGVLDRGVIKIFFEKEHLHFRMDEIQQNEVSPDNADDFFRCPFEDLNEELNEELRACFETPPPPAIIQPSVTCSVQMRSADDKDLYMVAEERKVQIPIDSNSARRAVLNALRTIVPCRAVLKIYDILVDLLLYDFFYRGTELRMVVIVLDTQEVYDAFAFKQDLLHVLASCNVIIQRTAVDWNAWLKKEPSFEGFYIKCQGSGNQFQSLHRAICSAAKHLKFNQSLLNWLSDDNRFFFGAARVLNVPSTWKAVSPDLAHSLYANPELFALTEQYDCPQYNKTKRICACDMAKIDYWQEASGCPWLARRLLPYVPSSVAWQVRLLLQPCMSDIRRVYWTTTAAPQPVVAGPIIAPKLEEKVPNKVHPVYDNKGQQKRCISCSSPAVCYNVDCCEPSNPVYCAAHARKELNDKGLVDLITCPVHQITGRIAQLL